LDLISSFKSACITKFLFSSGLSDFTPTNFISYFVSMLHASAPSFVPCGRDACLSVHSLELPTLVMLL
jgi:hypothetical protein